MILFVECPSGERKWFKVDDVEDLSPVFAMFPSTRDVAMNSDTLREALDGVAEYLSGHFMNAWVEDKDLSKSLRAKALALGMSLATAAGAAAQQNAPVQYPTWMPDVTNEQKPETDFGMHPMDRFLWNIAQIESSGGKNVRHKPVMHGKLKGNKAIGKWGLLKPTIDEMTQRMRARGILSPQMAPLGAMSRDKAEEYLKKNPQVELDLARHLADHIMKRQNGNVHRAAFSWNNGHNLHSHDIPKLKLLHSDYVSKYKQFDKVNPFAQKRAPASISKSMPSVDNEDFKMRVKNWFKRREEEITDEPMRSSNFQPDPGRLRNPELDAVEPGSMKTSMERLEENIRRVNEKI